MSDFLLLVSSSSCAKLVEAHITGNGSHLASNRAPLKNLRAIKKGSFRCQTPTCLCKSLLIFRQFLTFAFWVSCLLQDLALAQHPGFSRSCPPPIFVKRTTSINSKMQNTKRMLQRPIPILTKQKGKHLGVFQSL